MKRLRPIPAGAPVRRLGAQVAIVKAVQKGFSLVEVLVSMAVLATSAAGLAGLFVVSTRLTQDARIDTVAVIAAQSKMASLRALSFTWAGGVAVTDAALAPSGASLSSDVAGCVDYLDARGEVVAPGAAAVYRRRWQVAPLPADPANAVVLQVSATPMARPGARDVRLVSVLARTAS